MQGNDGVTTQSLSPNFMAWSYIFAQHVFGNKIYKTFPKIGRLGLKSGEQEKNSQIGSLQPKSGELEPLFDIQVNLFFVLSLKHSVSKSFKSK